MAELSTITIAGETITVVSMPDRPGLRTFEPTISDAVALVPSPFTGQVQAQWWAGADMFAATCTLPPLTICQMDEWVSFLMACRGMLNGFMIGDPTKKWPRGAVNSSSTPVVSGTANTAGLTSISTRGWEASQLRLLLPGDYLQIGYRLYRNLSVVNTDAGGLATLLISPSLREDLADGDPLILKNPKGLFRLATNQRKWSSSYNRITALSFPVQEYR